MRAKYGGPYQAARRRMAARLRDGDPCARCGGPLFRDQPWEADHLEDGTLAPSHKRCNRRHGGQKSALMAGKVLAGQPKATCVCCGIAIKPSRQGIVTCGRLSCVTELRRTRREWQPDPVPPQPSGRRW